MKYGSRHWLAGGVLALAVLGGSTLVLALKAQTPNPSSTPSRTGTLPQPIPVSSMVPTGERSASVFNRQGDLVRFGRNVPGDAKPILIDADEITTWDHDGNVILLMTGRVLVQQSVVQSRFHQGIAWVDMRRFQSTGILHMDLYAEGQVRVDAGGELSDSNRAVLDLNTRGEFRLRASKGKVRRENRAMDPIVQRGRVLIQPAALAPPQPMPQPKEPMGLPPVPGVSGGLPPVPGISPGNNPTPALPTTLPPGVQPSNLPPVIPVPPPVVPAPSPTQSNPIRQMSFEERKPGSTSPAPSGIRLTQAISPATTEKPEPANLTPTPSKPASTDVIQPSPNPSRTSTIRLPDPPAHRVQQPGPGSSEIPPPTPPGDSLPPPVPVPGPAPLPPPSRPAVPPRPGQLPPTSSPERPLEHRILPRSGEAPNLKIEELASGQRIITVTGGLILNVRNVPRIGILDVEADRAVIWVSNRDANRVATNIRSDQGETSTELEFYLAGHVILRSQQPGGRDQTALEADELYYDARRNVAVALNSRLELRSKRFSGKSIKLDDPIILKSPELLRTGPNTFELRAAEINASKLPSDPGLKLLVDHATVTNRSRPRKTLFGTQLFDKSGAPATIEESILEAENVTAELQGVPVFWTPYLKTDVRDPLGPLESISLGVSNVMGFHVGVGLNMYKLLGYDAPEGHHWRILPDYMSRRGPAIGTIYEYSSKLDWLADSTDIYDTMPRYEGVARAFTIYDNATDILGGNRPYLPFHPSGGRGRVQWRQGVFDLPGGFNVISQLALLSDRNYLEQYFKREFDTDPNQANFLYVKQQQDNWAWTALGQVRQADWISTTEWLPRVDGYLLGESFFNLVTSNTQVSVGYAQLKPSNDPPQALRLPNGFGPIIDVDPQTQRVDTGRFAIFQELGVPLHLGALNLMPYAKGVLSEYTSDLNGQEIGRAWGGLGLRFNVPFTRLFPDVDSELFNVKGLNHKVTFGGNYFYARTNESYSRLPQLDRLHDDATLSMLREFKPQEPIFNRSSGLALATSPLYDPALYAIRRLVDNRFETLDDIQVAQFEVRQRLQTKRGAPGYEHIVDWMTLNSSISLFPDKEKDNFGKLFSFMEYQYLWNIGDRTALESTGWYDPQEKGARVYTIGMYFNRPDRTSFYVGYRQIDPLLSRMVTGSVTYVFSPKYSMTGSVAYDFGTREAITNTLIFTRTGTDLQVSLGVMYNSLQNNFGAIVEVVPNLVPFRRTGMNGTGGMFAPR